MPYTDRDLARLAARVGRYLSSGARRVATAESCTGGWIAKALTDIAGSSRWFIEGFVAYSNEAKVARLGVP
ncbi:MAG: CinA family protein, partial [Steroidobacteraceae bacterium]